MDDLLDIIPSHNQDISQMKDYLLVSLIHDFCQNRGLSSDQIIMKLRETQMIPHDFRVPNQEESRQQLDQISQHLFPKKVRPLVPLIQNQNRFTQEFRIIESIDDHVFLVQHYLDQQEYIIKRVPVSYENPEETLLEAQIMAELSHPHIVRYHTSWLQFQNHQLFLYLQMEACQGEITQLTNSDQEELHQTYLTIFEQISSALRYLHRKRIIHCDLKPANLLFGIDHENRLVGKIADFGCAHRLPPKNKTRIIPIQNQLYAAPEQLKESEVNQKLDLYGLGLTIYETLTKPDILERLYQFEKIRHHTLPRKFQKKHPQLSRLLKQMLRKDPRYRLKTETVYHRLKELSSS